MSDRRFAGLGRAREPLVRLRNLAFRGRARLG